MIDPQLSLEIDERTRLQSVWSQALKLAEGKLGREAVESWLRDTVPLSLTDGTLVLNAPNATARTWIEKKYAAAITGALTEVCDEDVRLEVVTRQAARSAKEPK